jgi:hypothetical protein
MSREKPPVAANDNRKGRTIEPFHRLYADGLLDYTPAMNAQLYHHGQQYKRLYRNAGGSLTHPPVYTEPSAGEFDSYRGVTRFPVDKSRPYFEAAKLLDDLGLRELVEAIVIHGKPVVEVGKVYSHRHQDQQARCAAITALGIGLQALRNHSDATNGAMAA